MQVTDVDSSQLLANHFKNKYAINPDYRYEWIKSRSKDCRIKTSWTLQIRGYISDCIIKRIPAYTFDELKNSYHSPVVVTYKNVTLPQ